MAALPDWLRDEPKRFHDYWHNPHRFKARHSSKFKWKLWTHGYLSPNFRTSEFNSKADNCGCAEVSCPASLRGYAQKHAFKLEIVRHRLGDPAMTPLSAGRSQCHNNCVGGAGASQHMEWRATDWGPQPNQAKFNEVMRSVFRGGGIGSVPGQGNRVAHVDSRGYPARWNYTW